MGQGEMSASLPKPTGSCYNHSYSMAYCNITLSRIKLRLNLSGMLYFMFSVCFVPVWIRMWFSRLFFSPNPLAQCGQTKGLSPTTTKEELADFRHEYP